MKALNHTAISVILLIITFCSNAQSEEESSEIKGIRATLMDYIGGTSYGQIDRLRRAFHPDFNLYAVDKDDILIRSGEKYINGFEEGKKTNRIGRILSIDYENNAATAKVEIVVPGWRVFTDYFLLLKYKNSWKIAQKSYTSRQFTSADNPVTPNKAVDSLFLAFDRPAHPAVAAVVIHKGEVVYKNAFGSINLDHKLPANTNTKFQLAALSRHFTAFAILLLEEQGKLSTSDDVSKYLPDLPTLKNPITINHLLSMTSGLADFWALKNVAGWDENDVLTQQQALEVIKSIKPGFEPGEDYIFTHTDQLILAKIVAKVTNQSFADFMKNELFEPLEMSSTLVRDNFQTFIPNVAGFYEPNEDGFQRREINFGITGPINVYSSVTDLAKWELNLLNPKVGSSELVKKLYTACTLNSGETMDMLYGRFAYAQQFFHNERGLSEIYQTGILGGHASSVFKFPDHDFTVIVLSSGIPYSGYLGMQAAYIFLKDHFTEPQSIDFTALKTKKLNRKKLESFTGKYWTERVGISRAIELKNDTLRYVRSDGRENALIPISNTRFQMVIGGDEKVFVDFSQVGETKKMNFITGDADPLVFEKVKPFSYSNAELLKFSGKYHCSALDITYDISLANNQLMAKSLRAGEIILNPISENLFEGNQWYFGGVRFDEDGAGFVINTEEIRGLQFKKIEP